MGQRKGIRAVRWALLVHAFAVTAAMSACAEPEALRIEQVIGSWEKTDDRLPPIHLELWLERDTLRARLRLSGSEAAGTATLEGKAVHLRLTGREAVLIADLTSNDELRLRLAGESYQLRKIAAPGGATPSAHGLGLMQQQP